MIKVASFLSDSELKAVKRGLEGQRIKCFVSNRGSVPGEYHDPYFEISVNSADYEKAKSVVDKALVKSLEENNKCPKCKATEYWAIEKKLWQRLFYLSTTPVVCKKCGCKYIV